MTLKTVTGPSTRDALAEARRLFGTDVVLLQSAPAAHGQPASVTVAFDAVPSPDRDITTSCAHEARTVQPARPEPAAAPTPRAYGYTNVQRARNAPPATPEPISASAPASTPTLDSSTPSPLPTGEDREAKASSQPKVGVSQQGEGFGMSSRHEASGRSSRGGMHSTRSLPASPTRDLGLRLRGDDVLGETGEPAESAASASEVAALRARLAHLEAVIAEVRAAAPPPVLRRAPLVLVGPGGSGKTSLALRLAQTPALTQAQCPAVLIVAPDRERFVDPASVFWGAGVPVALASTPDEVTEALLTFADADLLIVDTPSLPLSAERARPVVRRLGEMLAPLGDVEVHFVLDATRSRSTVTAETFGALGLAPDALALARLDEAPVDAALWADHLALPLRFTSSGPDLGDVSDAPLACPAPAAFAVEAVPERPVRTLTDLFEAAPVSTPPAFTHVPVLA